MFLKTEYIIQHFLPPLEIPSPRSQQIRHHKLQILRRLTLNPQNLLNLSSKFLTLHNPRHIRNGNNMIHRYIFLINRRENIRDTRLIAAVDPIYHDALYVTEFFLDDVDCIALHVCQLVEQIFVDMLWVLAAFQLVDYLLIVASFLNRLVNNIQHHILKYPIELVIEPMHRDITQYLVSDLAVDH